MHFDALFAGMGFHLVSLKRGEKTQEERLNGRKVKNEPVSVLWAEFL